MKETKRLTDKELHALVVRLVKNLKDEKKLVEMDRPNKSYLIQTDIELIEDDLMKFYSRKKESFNCTYYDFYCVFHIISLRLDERYAKYYSRQERTLVEVTEKSKRLVYDIVSNI